MNELFSYQNKILKGISDQWYRAGFYQTDWDQRMTGIKGLRGVGKTTMLLQYLKYHYPLSQQALYVTADHPWFYEHSLFDLIEEWDKYDGKLLIVDEIHKYPDWSRELKVGYDGFPNMQFIFSASSAFDIFQSEGDLSRRATINTLPGMSFREYIEFTHHISLPVIDLETLLSDAQALSQNIIDQIKPVPLFKKYLQQGYFPFSASEKEKYLQQKFNGIINTVLENDLAYIQDYSPSNISKIKQLLGVIAGAAPFTPNISKLADKLHVGRVTVYNYLKHLEDAGILNLIHKQGHGISQLQKPDKVYFENTNLAMALNNNTNSGAIRETFFFNQIKNAGYEISLANRGDFLVNNKYTIETGGKNKGTEQVKNLRNAYLAKDETEHAFNNQIPLWLFGFLY